MRKPLHTTPAHCSTKVPRADTQNSSDSRSRDIGGGLGMDLDWDDTFKDVPDSLLDEMFTW